MLWSSFVMRSTLSFSLTLPGPCQSASYGSAHAGRTALRSESDHPLHDMKCFWRLSLFFAVIVFALVGHFRRNKPRGENRKWKRWKVTLSVVTKLVLVMWKEKWTEQKKKQMKEWKKRTAKRKVISTYLWKDKLSSLPAVPKLTMRGQPGADTLLGQRKRNRWHRPPFQYSNTPQWMMSIESPYSVKTHSKSPESKAVHQSALDNVVTVFCFSLFVLREVVIIMWLLLR